MTCTLRIAMRPNQCCSAIVLIAALSWSCTDAASPVMDTAALDPAFNEGGGVARITFTGPASAVESDLAELGVIRTPPPLVRGDELAGNSGAESMAEVFFVPGDGVPDVVASRSHVLAIEPLHPAPYEPLSGPDPVSRGSAEVGPFRVEVRLDSVRYAAGSAYWITPRYTVTNTADTTATLRGFSHIPPDLREDPVCRDDFAVGTRVERYLSPGSSQTIQGDPASTDHASYPVVLTLGAGQTYACAAQEMLAVGDLGYPAPVASYRVAVRIAFEPAHDELELWVRIQE